MNVVENYTNPSIPGAFSGIHSFKKNNKKITNPKIELLKTETYTLHTPKRKKFQRRKTIADYIDHMWQIDLIDYKKYKAINNHYSYLLTCIDVFSRFAWVEPLKNKSSQECKLAFERIFKSGRIPKLIYSDLGNEFKGECKRFLIQEKINIIDTKSINKAALVERFNRTLKEKLSRYFTFTKKFRYIDALPEIVNNYNESYHRIIKTKPINVTLKNEKEIGEVLYGDERPDQYIVRFKFKIGDYVREIVDKKLFEKGYTPNFSKEVYIVYKRFPTKPPTYQIKSIDGKEYDWKYYKEELQMVKFDYDTFEVISQNKNKLKVRKLNSENQERELWIDKP